ncbi:hypothetical protein FQA39_LY05286 [Lamprigera yunnana]|nr:hypothetical protein FQA39_LY05286 [Lamprigera yunnana]
MCSRASWCILVVECISSFLRCQQLVFIITKIMSRCLPVAVLEALANTYDSDEDFEVLEQDHHISGKENHYENFYFEADNYDAIDVQQIQAISSKYKLIILNSKPFPQYGRGSFANVIKAIPGVTQYAISRITDIRSSFELVFHAFRQ